MQEGHPLSFTSKKSCDRNLVKSTYEKEMLVFLHAIDMYNLLLDGAYFPYLKKPSQLEIFLVIKVVLPRAENVCHKSVRL